MQCAAGAARQVGSLDGGSVSAGVMGLVWWIGLSWNVGSSPATVASLSQLRSHQMYSTLESEYMDPTREEGCRSRIGCATDSPMRSESESSSEEAPPSSTRALPHFGVPRSPASGGMRGESLAGAELIKSAAYVARDALLGLTMPTAAGCGSGRGSGTRGAA